MAQIRFLKHRMWLKIGLHSGVVLFPGATLPLRVIQPNFVAAIDRALGQVDARYTIGVVCELLITSA